LLDIKDVALSERIRKLEDNLIDLFLDLHKDSIEHNNRMKTISVNIPMLYQNKIEVLCFFGIYANRSELIRTAIRNQLKDDLEDLDVFAELKKLMKNPNMRQRFKKKFKK